MRGAQSGRPALQLNRISWVALRSPPGPQPVAGPYQGRRRGRLTRLRSSWLTNRSSQPTAPLLPPAAQSSSAANCPRFQPGSPAPDRGHSTFTRQACASDGHYTRRRRSYASGRGPRGLDAPGDRRGRPGPSQLHSRLATVAQSAAPPPPRTARPRPRPPAGSSLLTVGVHPSRGPAARRQAAPLLVRRRQRRQWREAAGHRRAARRRRHRRRSISARATYTPA